MQEEELAKVSSPKAQSRKISAAGTMYPADPAALASRLAELFAQTKSSKLSQAPLVVIAPHSEMGRCGEVTASAINHLVGHQYDTVVVIAPSHTGFFAGASVYNGSAYQTPLGEISVDKELVDELTSISPHIKKSSQGHSGKNYDDEFSLEAILPHLQLALGTFSLIPIITGDQEIPTARALGDCLHSCLKKRNALIVVATDLSHYHDKHKGERLDSRTRETILSLDAEQLINLHLAKQVEACGIVGIIAAIFFARRTGTDEVQELAYSQSEVSKDEMIGHSGIVITRSKISTRFIPERDDDTTGYEKTLTGVRVFLNKVARGAILGHASSEEMIYAPKDVASQRQLLKSYGLFVSIYKDDTLVGRAGYLRSNKPLSTTAGDVARSAFFDSNKTPDTIDETELAEYQIVNHVLSPLKRVKEFETIDLLTQGIMVKLDMNSAYMFPDELVQACDKPNPSIDEALSAICLKANLPRRAYAQSGAEVYIFNIETF